MPPAAITDPDTLAVDNLDLVHRIATKVSRRYSLDRHELAGHGMIGLVEAARRYQPHQGSFRRFASMRVYGAMIDGVRRDGLDSLGNAGAGGFGRYGATRIRKLRDAEHQLHARLGRAPTTDELAAQLGRPADEVCSYRDAARRNAVSLQLHLAGNRRGTSEYATLADTVCDRTAGDVGEDIEEAQLLAAVRAAVRRLPDRERTVIQLQLAGVTLAEAGRQLGVTESRACQLRAAAVARLRGWLLTHA